MKKTITLFAAVLGVAFTANAQNTAILAGDITSNRTLHNDTIYIMQEYVKVRSGATLTIEPGTIIKGDNTVGNGKPTMIITRGAKIIADGTKNQPIVFTSVQPAGSRLAGDWGGLVILGKATTNRPADCSTCAGAAVAAAEPGVQIQIEGDLDDAQGGGLYGGLDDNDNSGILRYVRIEFPGILITNNNEINGLTMGGVGSGTTIENVQVYSSNDDAFEWFGGTVNAKNLIATATLDDDLDTDFGYRGKVQFVIVQRDSTRNDPPSTSNIFESDNDNPFTTFTPRTRPVFSNVTAIGPKSGTLSAWGSIARIRRASQNSIFNSVLMNSPIGINLDNNGATIVYGAYAGDTLRLKDNITAGCGIDARTADAPNNGAMQTKFFGADGNDSLNTSAGIFVDALNYTSPNFQPAPSSPALTGASFTDSYLTDPFFTPTTYRGALSPTNNWIECWTNFNPQTELYATAPIDYKTVDANFSFTVSGNNTPSVSFTNTSVNGVTYSWNFDDNSAPSTDANPTHTFPNVIGSTTYDVTLIATQPCGNDTVVKQVTITIVGVSEIANPFNVSVYPNPTATTANINFALKAAEQTTINVYDVTGKVVANVVNGKLNAGKNTVSVETANLTNGIYFARIQAGSTVQTVRFTVAK